MLMTDETLKVLTNYSVDVPAIVVYIICKPVVERRDVIAVDDDVIHDVIGLEFAGGRFAAFDVTAKSIRVVVDGVAGPRVNFGEARLEADSLLVAAIEVRTLAVQSFRFVGDLHDLRMTRWSRPTSTATCCTVGFEIIIIIIIIIITSQLLLLLQQLQLLRLQLPCRKEVKYSDLPASFSFQPIAVETLGPISESAADFLRELGRRISSKFQEE